MNKHANIAILSGVSKKNDLFLVGPSLHSFLVAEFEYPSLHDVSHAYERRLQPPPVPSHVGERLPAAQFGSLDHKLSATGQCQRQLLEGGHAKGVDTRGRADGIEAEAAEEIPRRHLATVVITRKAVDAVVIVTTNLRNALLRLVKAPGIVVDRRSGVPARWDARSGLHRSWHRELLRRTPCHRRV